MGRKRRSFLLGGVLARSDGNEPAAESNGRQMATVGWFGTFRHALVNFVSMQAESLLLAVIAANGAASIGRMLDDGSPLEAKGLRPPIGLADAAKGGFQPVQLAAMEAERHAIPDTGAGGRCRSTGGGGQHPGIDRMAAECLRLLLARLDEAIVLPELAGDDARVQMNVQPLVLEQSIQMLFADLHRTEGRVPLSS
jgi:hypothetical protein